MKILCKVGWKAFILRSHFGSSLPQMDKCGGLWDE